MRDAVFCHGFLLENKDTRRGRSRAGLTFPRIVLKSFNNLLVSVVLAPRPANTQSRLEGGLCFLGCVYVRERLSHCWGMGKILALERKHRQGIGCTNAVRGLCLV
jgi:hypothetical protein